MNNNLIKQNIYNARTALGLTQDEVALKLGISQAAYQKIEIGSTSLINKRLFDIAKVLESSPNSLVLGYEPDQKRIDEKVNAIKEELAKKEKETNDNIHNLLNEKDKRIADLENIVKDKCEIIRLQSDKIIYLSKKIDENNG